MSIVRKKDCGAVSFWCGLVVLWAGMVVSRPGSAATTWDFEKGTAGLVLPGAFAAVVEEPGVPGSHVLRIDTNAPHHTIVRIAGSEGGHDVVLSLRLRVEDFTGRPPTLYLYAHQGQGGVFQALQIEAQNAHILCWRGRGVHSPRFGPGGVGFATGNGGWVRAKVARVGEWLAAKTWLDGRPEPRWQILGRDPSPNSGFAGFGVWTHPREPSRARVLFDDVSFTALGPGEASRYGLQFAPPAPLTPADIPSGTGVFSVGDDLGIRSGDTALRLDAASGMISSIVDVVSGQEFVDAEYRSPLFVCTLTQPSRGRRLSISAHDFAHVRLEKVNSRRLRIMFRDPLDLALTVTADIEAAADGTLRFRLNIVNGSDWCLADVAYPLAPGPAVLGGATGGEDHVLLPVQAGGLVTAPGKTPLRWGAEYPGGACAQFLVRYNRRSGIFWRTDDAKGWCKRLEVKALPESGVVLAFTHRRAEQPGVDFMLPYDVVLRTFRGDWMDAADLYRAWADKQPWCATPLAQRGDIPGFLKEGSGVIIASVSQAAARKKLFGANLERLPEVLDAYRRATGFRHMIFVPYGWENRGTWAGINYFPAVPSNETWRNATAELRRHGHRCAFLTSGSWWVVRRRRTGNGPAFDDTAQFEARKDMCIWRTDGTVWAVDKYETTRGGGSWRGYSVALCHGSAAARRTLKGIFLNVADLGVPLISFDQEIGGAQPAPCYRSDHGHAPGYGSWMWTDFRDLCREILAEGKPRYPELGLFLENVSELAIPSMATFWSRQFGEIDVGVAGARGVGLFSYLYHDVVTMIGAACVQGQGRLGVRPDALLRCRIMANNLTRGLIPGPFMSDVPLTGGDPWRRQVSRAYRTFAEPYANFPRYLVLGRCLRPPRVRCAGIRTFFYRANAKKGKPLRPGGVPVVKMSLTLDAVTAGSFRAADGSVGTVVVNATPEAQTATVTLRPDRDYTLYRGDGTRIAAGAPKPGSGVLTLSLEPFGVRMLVAAAR